MIIGIDHIIVAVENLDGAMETWRRLGFQVLVGGEHPQFGTHNAVVPLVDGAYFELIAIKNPELAREFPFGRQIQEALARENRFLGFALESGELNGDVGAIRDRGLEIQKAPPGGRVRPDGQQVGWRTAHPDNPLLPFLIQDTTPRELRVPVPTEGIGCSVRSGWVEVGATNLQPAITAFVHLLGDRPVDGRFAMQRGTIRVIQSTSGDAIQLLMLAANDLAPIVRGWQANDVSFYDHGLAGVGRVIIPTDAGGARISFCQAR